MKKHTGPWKSAVPKNVGGDGSVHPACLHTDALEDQKGFKQARAVEDVLKPYEKVRAPKLQIDEPYSRFKGQEVQ